MGDLFSSGTVGPRPFLFLFIPNLQVSSVFSHVLPAKSQTQKEQGQPAMPEPSKTMDQSKPLFFISCYLQYSTQ